MDAVHERTQDEHELVFVVQEVISDPAELRAIQAVESGSPAAVYEHAHGIPDPRYALLYEGIAHELAGDFQRELEVTRAMLDLDQSPRQRAKAGAALLDVLHRLGHYGSVVKLGQLFTRELVPTVSLWNNYLAGIQMMPERKAQARLGQELAYMMRTWPEGGFHDPVFRDALRHSPKHHVLRDFIRS